MSCVLLQACKDLIDDAKAGCVDLVFKELCLEILARAKSFLNPEEFSSLVSYASNRMEEKAVISVNAAE